MTGKVPSTPSEPLQPLNDFKVKLNKEVIQGFKISGQTAIKDFTIGEKNLRITIKFPNNIKNEADLKAFLKKNYGDEKIQLYGKMAVAAGVGIDATALSIKQSEGKLNFERFLRGGKLKTLMMNILRQKKLALKVQMLMNRVNKSN